MTRSTPFGAFNFIVTFGLFGAADSITAGFQEVSGLGIEVTMAEYRNGNEKQNHVRKVPGVYKVSDITLKRGVIGAKHFFDWIKDAREGNLAERQNQLIIELMDETGQNKVMTWKATNAVPMKYTAPTLNAKGGTDVAIEELVVSVEDLSVEV